MSGRLVGGMLMCGRLAGSPSPPPSPRIWQRGVGMRLSLASGGFGARAMGALTGAGWSRDSIPPSLLGCGLACVLLRGTDSNLCGSLASSRGRFCATNSTPRWPARQKCLGTDRAGVRACVRQGRPVMRVGGTQAAGALIQESRSRRRPSSCATRTTLGALGPPSLARRPRQPLTCPPPPKVCRKLASRPAGRRPQGRARATGRLRRWPTHQRRCGHPLRLPPPASAHRLARRNSPKR